MSENHQDNKSMTPDEIIEMKNEFFYPCAMHFYKNPPHLIKGEMQYLFDHEGKRYADFFAGVSVLNCGHSNPEIINSMKKQLALLQHTSIIYLTQPMVELAKELSKVLPGDIQNTFFCNSGTEANEGALLLARMHTNRKAFISFEGGLHGRSYLTMSVTGIPMWRIDPFLDQDVYFAKSFVNESMTANEAAEKSLESLDEILSTNGFSIAACIIEPIQGNGGMNTPPLDFFVKLKKRLEAHGILLIVDEVQTGFGRTGTFFAIEQFGVVPDIITYAKALGNGTPIGAFSARPEVASSFNKPSASTLGGNPVSCTAGLAVIEYIHSHQLCKRSLQMGLILKNGLLELQEKYPIIQDIRGLGLMLGMAFPSENGNQIVDTILEEMKNRGFLIGKNGMHRNVLAFQPPLIIEEIDVQEMLKTLDEVLKKIVLFT